MKKKEIAPPAEKFWKELVAMWYEFCRANFSGEEPSFDGSAPRDLKRIILALRVRAEKQQIEWTLDIAINRFMKFLNEAITYPWLKEHFLLSNLARQKDTIFFNLAKKNKNGSGKPEGFSGTFGIDEGTPVENVNPTRNFGQLFSD